jgi:hypothetical protein
MHEQGIRQNSTRQQSIHQQNIRQQNIRQQSIRQQTQGAHQIDLAYQKAAADASVFETAVRERGIRLLSFASVLVLSNQ